jgi:CPA1 family monovalent cation:H+ antiporter
MLPSVDDISSSPVRYCDRHRRSACLAHVINAIVRWRHRQTGFHPPRPMLRPTAGSGLVISWAGMRGIVSLAAAIALPVGFPYRDLILLVAFGVVLGTLVIQGLTLKALLRMLAFHDDDPVGRESQSARERALQAALASVGKNESPVARTVRQELSANLGSSVRADADNATRSRTAPSVARLSRLHARRCWPCAPAVRSVTTRFTASKRTWTGWRWRG